MDRSSSDHLETVLWNNRLAIVSPVDQGDPKIWNCLREAVVEEENMLRGLLETVRGGFHSAVLRQDGDANLISKARCSLPAQSFQTFVDVNLVDDLHRYPY